MDIDAIVLGDDFVKAIEKTASECDVLIALWSALASLSSCFCGKFLQSGEPAPRYKEQVDIVP
jgi:hypothetical protein